MQAFMNSKGSCFQRIKVSQQHAVGTVPFGQHTRSRVLELTGYIQQLLSPAKAAWLPHAFLPWTCPVLYRTTESDTLHPNCRLELLWAIHLPGGCSNPMATTGSS